jgi:hypothetical protein
MGLQVAAITGMNGHVDVENGRVLKVSWGRHARGQQAMPAAGLPGMPMAYQYQQPQPPAQYPYPQAQYHPLQGQQFMGMGQPPQMQMQGIPPQGPQGFAPPHMQNPQQQQQQQQHAQQFGQPMPVGAQLGATGNV